MQVRRAGTGSIQSMMVHASGRAEIGHHRAEQESTRALALVHAGPSMRCRQLGLSPLSSPQSVVIGSPPLALVPPTLALQKRNKRDPKPVLGPAVFGHLCQCAALPMEVRKCGRGQRGGEPGAVAPALDARVLSGTRKRVYLGSLQWCARSRGLGLSYAVGTSR